MKKHLSILLVFAFLLSFSAAFPVGAAQDISVYIDGVPVSFPAPPIIVNGTTLVPMRAMFEALGAEVDWDDEHQTAYGNAPGVFVSLTIGNSTMGRNFVDVPLAEPARLVNGNTFIPLRAVSECFGMKVDWDAPSNSVIMTSLGTIQESDWNSGYTFVGEIGAYSSGGYGILYNKTTGEPEKWGYFENGSFKEGANLFDNGDFYIGEFKNDALNGQGEYYCANGDYYIGEFKNGVPDGQGEYYWAEGDYYIGEWKNGAKEGQGECHYASGNYYIGEWKNDVKEGQGEFYWADGTYYVGEWKNGVREGQGECHYASGNYYIGEWKNDTMNGYGTFYFTDGTYGSDYWSNGKLIYAG